MEKNIFNKEHIAGQMAAFNGWSGCEQLAAYVNKNGYSNLHHHLNGQIELCKSILESIVFENEEYTYEKGLAMFIALEFVKDLIPIWELDLIEEFRKEIINLKNK